MVYTFIKADNTAAAFEISYIITVKIITMYNKKFQRKVLPEKLTVAQQLIQFIIFYRTHQFIAISTTASLTPFNLIPLAHLSSVLTYILH